jgi:hypothetical protein
MAGNRNNKCTSQSPLRTFLDVISRSALHRCLNRSRLTGATILLLACSHSDPLTVQVDDVGPSGTGSDVQLTFNSDQDYWPSLTEDGTGIMYAFVDATQSDVARRGHRCIGVMPVAGGTRFWEWCDNHFVQPDTLRSYPAFALGSDGRLLYLEATVARAFPFADPRTTLWLADSATPFRRTAVLSLPLIVGDSVVSWLADIAWTGPGTFVALAQRFVPAEHCPTPIGCP